MTREESIFAEALGKGSVVERDAYLDAACAGDAALRRGVAALLLAHERAEGILEAPPAGLDETSDVGPAVHGVGSTIGPYKLLEQIGGGGMGVVFMAEQVRPVRRKVALKIIKPGMDSGQVIARFEAERQALTMMDHPNIARVLDAGTTDAGRPYFVMELVKGVPITDFCDQARLDPRQRLDLFVQVCNAVQHAHQKGVIHRDLKPGNVLVTLHDDKPVPKVIDFGIAKATGQQLTERTLFTNYAQMLGTPLYMSPEQAQLSGLDVDTRSDVYSLGVLLYELLTGTTPFDKQRLREAAYDEMRRIIREEDPPKPSTRLGTMGDRIASVSAQRHTEPKKLSRLVHGELDWIVMKSLEKDRTRRYETANGLARDVERYLHDETVQACPPSAGYRFRKFARRNKTAAATAAVLTLAVLTVAGTAGWAARDRGARRDTAARQTELALQDAAGHLAQAQWPEALEALKRAEGFVDGMSSNGALRGRTADRRRDAEMAARLEDVWLRRYDSDEPAEGWAQRRLQRDRVSREFAEAFAAFGIDIDAPGDAAVARIRASSIPLQLATALDGWCSLCRQDDEAGVRRWKRLYSVARDADPDPVRNRLRDAVMEKGPAFKSRLAALADSEAVLAAPMTAERLAARLDPLDRHLSVAVLRKAQQRHPANFHLNYSLATSLSLLTPPRTQEAVRFYTAAVAIRPGNLVARRALAAALRDMKADDEAIGVLRATIAIDPQDAMARYLLATRLMDTGAKAEAVTEYEALVPLLRRLLQANPADAEAHHLLGHALDVGGRSDDAIAELRLAVAGGQDQTSNCLGHLLIASGAADEGIAALKHAIAANPDSPHAADAHLAIGAILCDDRHQPAAAIVHFTEALRLSPDDATAHQNLGVALEQLKRHDEAAASFRRSIQLAPTVATTHAALAEQLTALGELPGAIDAARAAIGLDAKLPNAHHALADALRAHGEPAEAVAAYRKAIELKPDLAEAYNNMALALKALGDVDEAVICLRRAIELNAKLPQPHNALASLLLDQGELEGAIAEYQALLAIEPGRAGAHHNLALALYRQGKLVEAAVSSRKAIELSPDMSWAHDLLGNILKAQGHVDDAIVSYRRAIEADPAYANARYNLGHTLNTRREYDEAVRCFGKAIELDPTHVMAHLNLADTLGFVGKTDDAIAVYRAALAIEPAHAPARAGLAALLTQKGEFDAAIVECRRAIEAKPEFAGGHYRLGAALSKRGDHAQAEAALREAVRLAPEDPDVHAWLGWTFEQRGARAEAEAAYRAALRLRPGDAFTQDKLVGLFQGRLAAPDALLDPAARVSFAREAVALLEKAVARDPRSSLHWQTLGWAHYRAGDWRASVEALDKSVELQESPEGGDAWQWLFLAMAHWQLGDKDEALRWYARAAESTEASPKERTIRFRAEAAALLGVPLPTWQDTWARALAKAEEAVATAGDAEAFDTRARLRARHGDFPEAAADFVKAIDLDPVPHLPWYQGGAVLAYRGDGKVFGDHCRAMSVRFGETADRNVAERMAKLMSCLPAEDSGLDPRRALALAERAVGDDSPHPDLPWFRTARGMAEYRAGNFDAAVTWTERARSAGPGAHTELAAIYEAMARHRLGQAAAAAELLRGAVARMDASHPELGQDDLTADGFHDFLFCLLARREAASFISGPGDAAVTK